MIIPLLNQYGVSIIISDDNSVSLHLISTYGEGIKPLNSQDFDNTSNHKKGVSLEHIMINDEFKFSNPFVTNEAQKVAEFLKAAKDWAKNRVESERSQ